MAGIIRPVIFEGGKYLAKGAVKGGGAVVKAAPVVTRPIREFSRAAITGAPRAVPLGQGGGTVTTIYASTRIGMQANALAKATGYAAVTRLPRATVKAVKFVVRSGIRDEIITPYVSPVVHLYGGLRNARNFRGVSTVVERYADKFVGASVKGLNKFGLAPTLRSDLFSVGRIFLFGGIYAGIQNARGALDDVEQYAKKVANDYEGLKGQLAARVNGMVPVQYPEPVPIPNAAPVVVQDKPPVVLPPAPFPRPAQPPVIHNQPLPIRRVR